MVLLRAPLYADNPEFDTPPRVEAEGPATPLSIEYEKERPASRHSRGLAMEDGVQ